MTEDRLNEHGSHSIEEQRKVEGFGDPQYVCDDRELAVRHAVYLFFQGREAAGDLQRHYMTQDWQGNVLHVEGSFRPAELARRIMESLG